MKKNFSMLIITLVAAFLLVACQGSNTASGDEAGGNNGTEREETEQRKITLIAASYPVYDFSKKIAGDRANVVSIVPEGQSPHGFEPSPTDIADLEKADIFVYNGAGLEGWTDKVLESLDTEKLMTVDSSEGVELIKSTHTHDHDHEEEDHDEDHDEHDHEHEEHEHHDHGPMDPHIWLDPENAAIQMENILNALVEADPENAEYYQENFEENRKKLAALDESFHNGLKDISQREIVVSHEAFGYLCHAYDLKQIGIEGINSSSEPDPKTMAEIVEYMNKTGIKTVFSETLVDPKVAESIAKETGAEVTVLDPVEGLTEENQKAGKEYFSIMEENLQVLEKALK